MPIKLPPARPVVALPNLAQPLPATAQVVQAAGGTFRIDRIVLVDSGRRSGVEILLIDTGRVRAAILPTRGMSLWRAHIDGIDLGWKSPVDGPIHPQWVEISEPSGIGWLDGFDELLVRCGMQSFGAPDFDSKTGRLAYPLHGRVGNLPADSLEIEVDSAHSLLHVRGRVVESRFLQYNLQLHTAYTFALASPVIEIHDRVRNAGQTAAGIQMLYHINIGQPLLSAGAKLHLAPDRIVARDAHAANDLADWATYADPTPGYVEQVYFSSSKPAAKGWASSMLVASDKKRAFAVHYETKNLPFFSQWKNTVGELDGYVTGIEPGTGFPNPRTFEQEHGRVVKLDSEAELEFNLKLEGIATVDRIEQLSKQLQSGADAQGVPFDDQWCLPRD